MILRTVTANSAWRVTSGPDVSPWLPCDADLPIRHSFAYAPGQDLMLPLFVRLPKRTQFFPFACGVEPTFLGDCVERPVATLPFACAYEQATHFLGTFTWLSW